MNRFGLTNNQLKLIAIVTMTVDHIGMILFPRVLLLRAIGRLAFPIFAYMIAEGCRHTRSMPRYFGIMALFSLACQGVYWVAEGSLHQSIMTTFTLSIGIILLLQWAKKQGRSVCFLLPVAAIAAAFLIAEVLPSFLPGTRFSIDYGFVGIMIPVGIYLARTHLSQLLVCAAGLALLAADSWTGQWYALLALPLLALYNGKRGKHNMKWLFYLYYPLHLAALYLLSMIL